MPHSCSSGTFSTPLLSPDSPPGGTGGVGARTQILDDPPPPKIQAFEQRIGSASKKGEECWKRSPNMSGTGAMHVKTFHCKLNSESLDFMDQQINDWLDAHPQCEVKLVSNCVGDWTGKTGKEPNLIVQVWV